MICVVCTRERKREREKERKKKKKGSWLREVFEERVWMISIKENCFEIEIWVTV